MDYEDRISIPTPEGVSLDVTLAGVGSRFTAGLIDGLIQYAALIALVLGLGLVSAATEAADALSVAGFTLAAFAVLFGYDIAFETLNSGRTPGKQAAGIRVVRTSGAPVGFTTSAVRNLLRLVDILPGMYLVGIVAILASSRNQRLGDIAAGTLVVRDRRAGRRLALAGVGAAGVGAAGVDHLDGAADAGAGWDVSGVTADELATVRRFLDRRQSLLPDARARLAYQLAARLRPKVAGPQEDLHPETFLAELAAAKASRG